MASEADRVMRQMLYMHSMVLQMDRKHLLGQDALLRHIATEWGQGAIDLLARALHLEPGMRCTAAEALAMPFLA